ncbi:hypothetical protein ACSQ67_023972 [Phaseolus vulgaris]
MMKLNTIRVRVEDEPSSSSSSLAQSPSSIGSGLTESPPNELNSTTQGELVEGRGARQRRAPGWMDDYVTEGRFFDGEDLNAMMEGSLRRSGADGLGSGPLQVGADFSLSEYGAGKEGRKGEHDERTCVTYRNERMDSKVEKEANNFTHVVLGNELKKKPLEQERAEDEDGGCVGRGVKTYQRRRKTKGLVDLDGSMSHPRRSVRIRNKCPRVHSQPILDKVCTVVSLDGDIDKRNPRLRESDSSEEPVKLWEISRKEELLGIDTKPYTFSYSELKNATNDFSLENKLGEGGFGSVHKGTLNDGRAIAVKRLSIGSNQGKSQFVTQIATISVVQHRNLVQLYGCCIKGREKLLVYEYLANKSLDQALFEKADVFSFGVMALELVSGRPNSYSSMEEEKAWELHESNCISDLVDPRLIELDEEEVKGIVGIVLLCTQASPILRPSIGVHYAITVTILNIAVSIPQHHSLVIRGFLRVRKHLAVHHLRRNVTVAPNLLRKARSTIL